MGCCVSGEKKEKKERNKTRKQQEKTERVEDKRAVEDYLKGADAKTLAVKHSGKLELLTPGSRLQKYWVEVTVEPKTTPSTSDAPIQPVTFPIPALLSIAPVSKSCPLQLNSETLETLNKILRKVEEHPYIHPIYNISYLPQHKKVVMVQKLVEDGSLKDKICPIKRKMRKRAEMKNSWSKKYNPEECDDLSADKIAFYGRHVLEAVTFLYSKGFPSLGHIHTGNIFIEEEDGEEVCRLGGYENRLLGYRSRLYRQLYEENRLDSTDIIMFGHVIFEMGAGEPLDKLLPDKETDYELVKAESVREVLKFIFDGSHVTMKTILQQSFFQSASVDTSRLGKVKVKMSTKKKALLEKVTRNVPVEQESPPPKPPDVTTEGDVRGIKEKNKLKCDNPEVTQPLLNKN